MHTARPATGWMLPGIGANEALFHRLVGVWAGIRWEVPAQPAVHAQETLPEFTNRWASQVPGPQRPRILVGFSFGGILACELSQLLKPDAVFLLAASSDREMLSFQFRTLARLSTACPDSILRRFVQGPALRKFLRREALSREDRDRLVQMAQNFDPVAFRWSVREAARWKGTVLNCPVYRLQGEGDFVIPRLGNPTPEPVPGAGHLIPLSHAEGVRAFVKQKLQSLNIS